MLLSAVRLCCVPLLLSCATGWASPWPSWRGPHGTGTADGDRYPTHWSGTQNLCWTIPLPGPGGSTPVISGQRIFVTLNAHGTNQVLCIDLNGRILWSQTLGKETPGRHRKATGANSSPITDGQRVFAYFSSGDLGCFDFDGRLLWATNVQERFGKITPETLWWDLGTSPALIDDGLVLCCEQSGPSWVAAFRSRDGELLWKVDRDLPAPMEANQSYSTPAVLREADGSQTVIVLGSDHVTAYSATDGSERWRAGGLNPDGEKYFRSIASPVAAGHLVLAPYARGTTLTAIRTGGSGDVTHTHVLYTKHGTWSDVPTPAIHNNRVFVCSDGKRSRGTVFCLDLPSGDVVWEGRLPRHRLTYSASPVVAAGHLYVTREDGTVFVIDAESDAFRIVAENQIADEFTVSTPAFADGRIVLRSHESLSLIGRPPAATRRPETSPEIVR